MDPEFILVACEECKVIRSYNINTAESKTIYTRCKPGSVCKGLDRSVFVTDVEGELLQLEWKEEKKTTETGSQNTTRCEGCLGNVLHGTVQHPGHHISSQH